MKITLKNFRCYENSTFDFGEGGLALLSGASGAGKTSILLGVYFALFGTGTKLTMYGKSSCSITLEFNGMTIIRSKKPNRLIVDSIYEDDVAQSIIDKKFGGSFKTTGYISQNARDSFILMSPIEKLEFLENFAFQDVDISILKKRCKDLINERNNSLLKTTSQLEIATLMLEQLIKPEEVKFPLKCSQKNIEKAIKNEIIKNKNTITLMNTCKKKINLLEKEHHSVQILNAQIESKQDLLYSIIKKLVNISLEESKIEYVGDEKVIEYQNQLSMIISQRELIILQERYNEDVIRLKKMKSDEKDEKDKKIKSIKENQWLEYSKEECISTMTEYKQNIKDLEKLADLKNNLKLYTVDENQIQCNIDDLKKNKITLNENEKLLDKLKMQQEVFKCPSCSIQLKFQDNDLQVYVNDKIESIEDIDVVSDIISKLKRKISSLELSIQTQQNKLERYKEIFKSIKKIEDQYDEIPNISEIKSDLEYIKNYKSSQEELVRQLNDIGDNFSSSIISFEKSLKQQENKIKLNSSGDNKNFNPLDINEEELRLNIITQKRNKEILNSIKEDIKNLSKKKTIYEKDINTCTQEYIDKYKNIRTPSEVKEKIQKYSDELLEHEEKQKEYQLNIDNVEKYQEYKKAIDSYDSWSTKIDVLQKEELECRKLYAASTLLREKILESESIAMMNVIASINTHTQGYLEDFFPDNPISVKLVPFKETKSGKNIKIKPQINLEIEYKGMEADINMLSGGELSRVILAFALALGEMFNTPMMLLDECTASLDQELTGVVMDGIREHFTGKLVIIIAHQCIEGSYDTVIKI